MKKGDIIKNKDGSTRKILGICGEVFLLSYPNNHNVYYGAYTLRELEYSGCEIPKEKWKPERDEWYYSVDSSCVREYPWLNDRTDNKHYELGNCFKTKEEAQIAFDKIKEVLKGL